MRILGNISFEINVEADVTPPAIVPVLLSDFKNGVYEVNGTPIAVTDLWENSPYSTFNAAQIQAAVGWDFPAAGGGGQLKNSPRDAVGFEFVCVITQLLTPGGSDYPYCGLGLGPETIPYPNSDSWFLDIWGALPDTRVGLEGHYRNTYWSGFAGADSIDVAHKVAVYFDGVTTAVSINGAANAVDADASGPMATTEITYYGSPGSVASNIVLEKIEFYSLTDYGKADLPTLSAL